MMQTATATKPPKVYVAVKADFAADGTMFPRIITWEDGEKYEIDRVSDIRQAPALKAGGQGDRYTIWIGGHQSPVIDSFSPICFSSRHSYHKLRATLITTVNRISTAACSLVSSYANNIISIEPYLVK